MLTEDARTSNSPLNPGTPSRLAARFRTLWPPTSRRPLAPIALSLPRSSPAGSPHLLEYLDELEVWSQAVWGGAGVCRGWLPGPILEQLRDQWWAADRVPGDQVLRSRIGAFWVGVTPWASWNGGVPPLPDPPPDAKLLACILECLRREIERSGNPVFGRERREALEAAARRIELLDRPARSA